jgi:two-component system response regulator HydG
MNKLHSVLSQASRKHPVIGVAAGSGQVVRYAVEAGCDLLFALNASVYRNLGLGSLVSFLPFANANQQTMTLLEEQILPRSEGVPVVAGVLSSDPTFDRGRAFSRLKELGVEGVVNWPAVGFVDGRLREALEFEGMGLECEAAMLEYAKAAGLVTFAFALEDHAVRRFAAAGVNAMILDVGLTRQISGIREKRDHLQQAIARLNNMLRISRQADPSRVVWSTAGPLQR